MPLSRLMLLSMLVFAAPIAPAPDASTLPTTPPRIQVAERAHSLEIAREVLPLYPAEAKEKDIEGTEELRVVIDRDGSVLELNPVSGDPILAQAALAAVRQWRYKPMRKDDVPVRVDTTVSVSFCLAGGNARVRIPASGSPLKASSAPQSQPFAAQSESFPDTQEGMQHLLQRLLVAIQKRDSGQISSLTHSLILPGYQTWFPQVFGADMGTHMAERYEKALPDFEAKFQELMARYVQYGMTAVTITRVESPDQPTNDSYATRTIQSMREPVPIYSVAMVDSGKTAWNFPGFFSFVEGNFRYVGWEALREVPNLLPPEAPPDRAFHSVPSAKLVHMVNPEYPSSAKSSHIQGTEVFHAVIGKDGKIEELKWLSGPSALIEPAAAAIKQWRYQPTLLDGRPVEVSTTISVVFTLGHK